MLFAISQTDKAREDLTCYELSFTVMLLRLGISFSINLLELAYLLRSCSFATASLLTSGSLSTNRFSYMGTISLSTISLEKNSHSYAAISATENLSLHVIILFSAACLNGGIICSLIRY